MYCKHLLKRRLRSSG